MLNPSVFRRFCSFDFLCLGYLSCSFLLVSAPLSWADNLYEASVPVLDQSSGERRLALQDTLAIVLVRASGQPLKVLEQNTILKIQQIKPESYLLEYRYQSLGSPINSSEFVEPQPTAMLQASFSPVLIRSLLQKAGVALWPVNRPTVLVWWQVEGASSEKGQVERSFNSTEAFGKEAQRRGVPMVLPMKDSQDQKVADGLWRFEPEAVAKVAERYGIQQILVGRAIANPAGWSGQWLFYFRNQITKYPVAEAGLPAPWQQASSLDELAATGAQLAVDELLKHYAIDLSAGEQTTTLIVSSVERFRSYMETLQYLQSLEPVSAVGLLKIEGTTQYYQVRYAGSLSVLQELIPLNGLLVVDEAPVVEIKKQKLVQEIKPEVTASITTNIPVDINTSTAIEIMTEESKALVARSTEEKSVPTILYYRYIPRF